MRIVVKRGGNQRLGVLIVGLLFSRFSLRYFQSQLNEDGVEPYEV